MGGQPILGATFDAAQGERVIEARGWGEPERRRARPPAGVAARMVPLVVVAVGLARLSWSSGVAWTTALGFGAVAPVGGAARPGTPVPAPLRDRRLRVGRDRRRPHRRARPRDDGRTLTIPAVRSWGVDREPEFPPVAVAWFPAGDYERALALWPDLAELWRDIPHREYCRRFQASMRGWTRAAGVHFLVAVHLDDYLAWCDAGGRDPAESRAAHAADELRQGRAIPWPPGRNEPCWCGSGQKYKRCCDTVTAVAMHPLQAEL